MTILDETIEAQPSPTLAQAIQRLQEDAGAANYPQLEIEDSKLAKIEAYCEILWNWNEKINLTRHTNYDLFTRRDLLDSARLAALLAPEEEILDIGTGGGVPGLLLAILRPDLTVHVCDSVEKKSRVVQDLVDRLELPVAVHAAKAQVVLEDMRYHSLVTRAVGSLAKLLGWLSDHWISFDRLLAIKGPRWVEERGEARTKGLLANLELRKLDSYPMPGTESESVILEVCRMKS